MHRKHIAGVVALAAVVAALVLSSVGGAAVDRHARTAGGCPTPGNFVQGGGKPGDWIDLQIGKAGKFVTWVYFKAKVGGSVTWIPADNVAWGSNRVYAQIPAAAYADGIVDGPIAVWSTCANAYLLTSKNFHLS